MTSELILAPEKRRNVADIRSAAIARRLGSLLMLTPGETEFLHRVGAGPMSLWAPRSLIEQPAGNHASPRYIISGWAAQVRELNDGRRQLVQLVLPGDPLAPQLQIDNRGRTVQCLTMVQTVDGAAIRLAARDPVKFPGIAAAVELAAAYDRALLQEQVTRLGRQTAFERMANLFLELHHRCLPVGLVQGDSFSCPLTQESLGDVLGLSVVHVNRTLQLMRRQNLITLRQGRLTLHDMPALRTAAEFKPPQLERLQ
ncbi:MAG TPA: Crp/Fnr family transcriptional regulator [Hyphomonadaceae bacterium]